MTIAFALGKFPVSKRLNSSHTVYYEIEIAKKLQKWVFTRQCKTPEILFYQTVRQFILVNYGEPSYFSLMKEVLGIFLYSLVRFLNETKAT